MTATRLTNRAVIRLSAQDESEDVRGFLQGLVTNDVTGPLPCWAAISCARARAARDIAPWARSTWP